MMKPAYLILENGDVFKGVAFGAIKETVGEVVFTTAMTGYIETLTDPSYYGQIVVQTFPLVGNYGIISDDFESSKPHLCAYIVKYPCDCPSNFRSEGGLDDYLKKNNIAGLCGIDTRKLVKIIRSYGTLNGKITYSLPQQKDREDAAAFFIESALRKVSRQEICKVGNGKRQIALFDFGKKQGIENALLKRDCSVICLPFDTPLRDVLSFNPDGVVLSNGPGNPADKSNAQIIETVKGLFKSGIPMMGICLGHQLLAIANGYKTRRLKFGHRGANQPVMDTQTGKTYITSQNHGYEVVCQNGSFINVNDNSCEGLDYGVSFSVQFHPEACGGPLDTMFLFDKFLKRVDLYAKK